MPVAGGRWPVARLWPGEGAAVSAQREVHDPVVHARLVALAAQGLGQVPSGFGEQVPAGEAAAHHVHHRGDVDDRPHPGLDHGGRDRAR